MGYLLSLFFVWAVIGAVLLTEDDARASSRRIRSEREERDRQIADLNAKRARIVGRKRR